MDALDQDVIRNDSFPTNYGYWIREIKYKGSLQSDTRESKPIELHLGADIALKLFTGM